ncbi:unnamed protein product [Heterobilharzia americana]|nr:unnamed protein product [Heterobilharzia americana]
MAFSVVKGKIERVLDKNLQDLVRGIRKHGVDETKYIGDCIDEIKNELKQGSFSVKANAISKLIYIQMLGYDISWAVFNIVEVMSSQKFTFKRIGYLAASQSFHSGTDVLMLATNLIRKDLTSANLYDAGIALSGIACFINTDLATDLYSDIMGLMNSPKPYLRKKTVLLLYKVFLNYPEALRICFPQLKDKLDDPDAGVQSAAVNVICELARKNPKNYLSLSPIFFKLMTTSTNNWVLIKIIKLFGTLTPLEPRLGKKLIGPLTSLIHSTSAMSLLYECINTIVAVLISISSGIPSHQASIQLCVQKLRILIEDSDQNLKYLGLLAMRKILLYHPQSVQPHKDLILSCLDDKDESIRLRALDLLHGMVSKTNLTDIVKHLMIHIGNMSAGTHYRNELLNKVVYICSQDNYHYVTSFEWYVTVLVELASIDGIRNGELLAAQLMDVAIRVPTVRAFCVEQMAILLDLSHSLTNGAKQNAIQETLRAAAWICGEYANSLTNPEQTLNSIISIALEIPGLPCSIQAILLFNAFKIYNIVIKNLINKTVENICTPSVNTKLNGDSEQLIMNINHNIDNVEQFEELKTVQDLIIHLIELTNFLMRKFTHYIHSSDLEVQERAVSIHQLLSLVTKRLTKIESFLTTSSAVPHPDSSKPVLKNHPPITSPSHQSLNNLESQLQRLPPSGLAVTNTPINVSTGDNDDTPSRRSSMQKETLPTITSALSPSVVLNLIQLITDELNALFAGEIIPVAPKAQKKVPIPEGLDLDAWINPPAPVRKQPWRNTVDFIGLSNKSVNDDHSMHWNKELNNTEGDIFTDLQDCKPHSVQLTPEELAEMRSRRLQNQENNPNYLKPINLKKNNVPQSEDSLTGQHRDAINSDSPSITGKAKTTGDQRFQTPNIGRTLATSDQFAADIRKRFQTIASNDNRKLRSTGDKLKKSRQKNHSTLTIDSKAVNVIEKLGEENEVNHIKDKLAASHIVRCEYDMPEGVSIENELLTDPEDTSDPHHRLNIVLDDFITQENKPYASTSSRLAKHSMKHKNSSIKASKLSVKNQETDKEGKEKVNHHESVHKLELSEDFNNNNLLDHDKADEATPRSGYIAFDSDMKQSKKSSKTTHSKTSLTSSRDNNNDYQCHDSSISSFQYDELITNNTFVSKSQYCISSTMNNEKFTTLLSSGKLNASQSTKIQCPSLLSLIRTSVKHNSSSLINTNKIFTQIISMLEKKVPCSIIELLDNRAASFYTEDNLLKEPLCILMKISVSF